MRVAVWHALAGGSREAALVHATVSAGVMYSVSRDCREGRIAACRCKTDPHKQVYTTLQFYITIAI